MSNEEEYQELSKFDQIIDKFWLWVFKIAAFTFFIWWVFWWDHSSIWSNKVIAYPLICSKEYIGDDCPGLESIYYPINYRISKERAEVVFMTTPSTSPITLPKCSIFDKENWKCPRGDGFTSVHFVNGIPQSPNSKVRYVSQWKYRFIELGDLFN